MQVLVWEINFKVGGELATGTINWKSELSLRARSTWKRRQGVWQWGSRTLWGSLAAGSKEPVVGDYSSCAGNSDPLSGIRISTFITGKEAGPGG